MRIADVLRDKGSDVCTAEPNALLSELLDLMAGRNIGAVVVLDGDEVVGIVSERDVVRALYQRGTNIASCTAAEIMSSPVVTCTPSDTVDDLSKTMTERRFRHLPVLDGGRLAGIVSIGDVVKHRVAQLEAHREQLESYIAQG